MAIVFQPPRPQHETCDEVLKNVCRSFFNHWHFKNQLVEPSLTQIRIMSSKFSFPTKAFSIERIDKADNLSSGPTRGGTKGTSYPGPVGTGTREDKSAQAKFFCNQAQT